MGSALSMGKSRVSAAAAFSSSFKIMSFGRDATHSSCDGMGSSSLQSSHSIGTFHVFISFRGQDVRNTFLAHLHHALVQQGIRAYVDGEDLQSGEEITSSLKKAINDSRIAIVTFSKNYASSQWCLDELVEIVNCRKQGKLILKPVFYRMDPREVRTPRYRFKEALTTHEFRLGKDSDKLWRWREALSEAGNLSGWHLDANRNEAELVRKIVQDVNELLDCTHLDVAKYPVGMESRVAPIKKLLTMESDTVRLIGLWGMAGVGKTTLAKAVFNDVANQLDGCAFLHNIREESANPSVGLPKLQEKLLSGTLGRKDVTVGSMASGISRIRDRLGKKKVLLLLDDISSPEQLDALAGGLNWFGKGSRILITTRDRSLIATHDQHMVHKVEGLSYAQAFQLFCRHAFPGKENRPNVAKDLVDRCLAYCDALPLALVVLGTLLRNRDERHWRSILKVLEQSPCEEIDKVLRVSFDGLDNYAREIFLHIALFFKGKRRTEIEKAMDACGFQTSLVIDMLIERSLITIVKDTTTCGLTLETVEIHPLLQSMCHNIVHLENRAEPGKKSRLLDYRHTNHMLSNGTGTRTFNGLPWRSPHEFHCIKSSGYSAPNTLFSHPGKFPKGVTARCKGNLRGSSRVGLDDNSRRNGEFASSVVECRTRVWYKLSVLKSFPRMNHFIQHPLRCVC